MGIQVKSEKLKIHQICNLFSFSYPFSPLPAPKHADRGIFRYEKATNAFKRLIFSD